MATPPRRPMGAVAKAVYREIRGIPGAKRAHPGLVELALSAADMLDGGCDPQYRMSATKEIKLLLQAMRPPAAKSQEDTSEQEAILAELAKPL